MGKIKTKMIKRVSIKIVDDNRDEFTKGDFDENKKRVNKLLDVKSKKIRNVVSGYITRLIKDKKTTKITEAKNGRRTTRQDTRRKK